MSSPVTIITWAFKTCTKSKNKTTLRHFLAHDYSEFKSLIICPQQTSLEFVLSLIAFAGEVVQGHDAAGPDERAPHGVLRQQARPHPQERRGAGLWQLLMHRRQQVNYLSRQCGHLAMWPFNEPSFYPLPYDMPLVFWRSLF